jgi:hypothetical protein
MYKKGTIFEEIDEMYVVKNEFARCMALDFFTDIKTGVTFDKIMEKLNQIDITETMYYQYNVRSLDNQIKFQKEKYETLLKMKESFMKKFKQI